MKKFTQSRLWQEITGLFWAFLAAMFIRTFLFQPYIIPSASMKPTLLIGDFLFASKYAYGYTKASFPLHLAPLKQPLFKTAPMVGDVVIFNNPKDFDFKFAGVEYGKDYIKRCVGKPGDRIQMIAGILHINGKAVDLKADGDFHTTIQGRAVVAKRYIETLPNGVKHPILKFIPNGKARLDHTPEFTVPPGHYFMMGDNRDNSLDSRVPNVVGFVPEENIIGKAIFRWFSVEEARWWEVWNYPFTVRFQRIFTSID